MTQQVSAILRMSQNVSVILSNSQQFSAILSKSQNDSAILRKTEKQQILSSNLPHSREELLAVVLGGLGSALFKVLRKERGVGEVQPLGNGGNLHTLNLKQAFNRDYRIVANPLRGGA